MNLERRAYHSSSVVLRYACLFAIADGTVELITLVSSFAFSFVGKRLTVCREQKDTDGVIW